jgi:hypothetical protein
VAENRKSDIYQTLGSRSGRRSARRKRHLSTRSRYPTPHRGERRLSKRELRRRVVFWALVTALVGVGGYAWYKSRKYTVEPDRLLQPIPFKEPLGR